MLACRIWCIWQGQSLHIPSSTHRYSLAKGSQEETDKEIYFYIFILQHPLDFCFLTHLPALVLIRDAAKKLHLVRRGQSEQAPPRYSLASCPQRLSTSWSNVFMIIISVLEQNDYSLLEVEKWEIQAHLLNTDWKSLMAEPSQLAREPGETMMENLNPEADT